MVVDLDRRVKADTHLILRRRSPRSPRSPPRSPSRSPPRSPPPLPLLPRYSEFLAATVSMQVKLDRKTLEDAFNRLDVSNTKSLTKDDLTKALGEVYSEEHIQGERDRLLRERERERGRERERDGEWMRGCVRGARRKERRTIPYVPYVPCSQYIPTHSNTSQSIRICQYVCNPPTQTYWRRATRTGTTKSVWRSLWK